MGVAKSLLGAAAAVWAALVGWDQRPPGKLIIHHTAGPSNATVLDLDEEARRQKYKGIAYDKVIYRDGSIHQGRPDGVTGAHAQGCNANTLGIALPGNFMLQPPPPAQINGLIRCCAILCVRYGLNPFRDILGHRDVCATACPGDRLYALLPLVRSKVASVIREMPEWLREAAARR